MHVHGAGGPTRVLKISLAVTMAYIVLLVVAGIRAHSLALLSEAGHNLSDFLALLLSLVAVYFQSRPASSTKTYGYHRAGVLAALVNATSLVAVSFFIFYEAFRRLQHPQHVQAGVMMWVAAAGVVMNGVIALLLYRSSSRSGGDVNIRSALLHEVGDTLSTAAVIAGGWAILVTGDYWIDSALSFGIGVLILWSGFGIVRETLNILLEGTPRGMKLEKIESAIRSVERSQRRARSACMEHWIRDPRALLPYLNCRYSPISERAHLARREGALAAQLPHRSHDDPVRARGLLRSGARVCHPGGGERRAPS